MSRILLSTLNARYSHCAFGLRYLFANLKDLQSNAKIIEFTISQNPRDIVELILAAKPEIVGFGVYIWNTRQTYEVVSILKRVQPHLKIVLGGPEVSYESESQALCHLADLTIKGEGDLLFHQICDNFLNRGEWPQEKWISGNLPDIHALTLPYEYYSDQDIKNRVIYVEASRGCPYKCEYCLSSLDKSVRSFDTPLFLSEMEKLIQRGARSFKFIDRTFNLSAATSTKILRFFLDRISLGLFLHFEMVPDRLPDELRELIVQFPKGALQFEIGIQTWNPSVSRLVSRRQDYEKIKENFAFLAKHGNVHTHADLIVGLPSETIESFAIGFDALAELNPDEVQVGILKRLKGTPISRHDLEWEMVYQEQSPFQILQTKTMNYKTLQEMGRFANFWDLVANSGNFKSTLLLLKELSKTRSPQSLYWEFNELTHFLAKRHPQGHSVALLSLVESVWIYLIEKRQMDPEKAREMLVQDYSIDHKRDIPRFLRKDHETPGLQKNKKFLAKKIMPDSAQAATPARQRRHIT